MNYNMYEALLPGFIIIGVVITCLFIYIVVTEKAAKQLKKYNNLVQGLRIGMTRDEMFAINSDYLSHSVNEDNSETYVYQFIPIGASSKLSLNIRKSSVVIRDDAVVSFKTE